MTSTEEFIARLRDGYSLNYYTIALTALYIYDYLLTFSDEVRYAWRGRKTYVCYLFLVNRYFPITYRAWTILQGTWSGYTQEVCDRTAFIHVLAFVFCACVAQIILAVRVYAITFKNKYVVSCLALISAVQLGLGIYHTFLVATNPTSMSSQEIPNLRIPWCVISRHRTVEVTNTVLSLPFDVITFIVTVCYAAKQGGMRGARKGISSIWYTLLMDGTLYFMVIFTSHIIYTFTLILARPLVQLIPAIGIHAYVPIMISRLMLSIRKAAAAGEGWELYTRPSMFTSSGYDSQETIRFAAGRMPPTDIETINLDCLQRRAQ